MKSEGKKAESFEYENSKVVFHGKRIDILTVSEKNCHGKDVQREIVSHPGAVVILPLLDSQTVLLIRNKRPVVNRTLWELPAGTLERGEDPLTCAHRELEEETGYLAGKISHMLDFFASPGFCNEVLYTYLAQDLTFVGQRLDDTEHIEVEPVSLIQALEMIKKGIICDAKTICALLYLKTYSKN